MSNTTTTSRTGRNASAAVAIHPAGLGRVVAAPPEDDAADRPHDDNPVSFAPGRATVCYGNNAEPLPHHVAGHSWMRSRRHTQAH